MSELDRIRERVRQNRQAQREAITDHAGPMSCPEGRMGCALMPGTIVFDTVTGLTGEVIAGTRENVVVPTAGR
jgi:hypothetical protein